jgi:hypothetical protein
MQHHDKIKLVLEVLAYYEDVSGDVIEPIRLAQVRRIRKETKRCTSQPILLYMLKQECNAVTHINWFANLLCLPLYSRLKDLLLELIKTIDLEGQLACVKEHMQLLMREKKELENLLKSEASRSSTIIHRLEEEIIQLKHALIKVSHQQVMEVIPSSNQHEPQGFFHANK